MASFPVWQLQVGFTMQWSKNVMTGQNLEGINRKRMESFSHNNNNKNNEKMKKKAYTILYTKILIEPGPIKQKTIHNRVFMNHGFSILN